MILKGIDNSIVEIKIAGYQFPESLVPGDYDSNWLNIFLRVSSGRKNWNSTDPSLLTWEVQELADWFRNIADRTASQPGIEFIEPNLSFELVERNDMAIRLRVILQYESSYSFDKASRIDFDLTDDQLKRLANDLGAELSSYPKR